MLDFASAPTPARPRPVTRLRVMNSRLSMRLWASSQRSASRNRYSCSLGPLICFPNGSLLWDIIQKSTAELNCSMATQGAELRPERQDLWLPTQKGGESKSPAVGLRRREFYLNGQ